MLAAILILTQQPHLAVPNRVFDALQAKGMRVETRDRSMALVSWQGVSKLLWASETGTGKILITTRSCYRTPELLFAEQFEKWTQESPLRVEGIQTRIDGNLYLDLDTQVKLDSTAIELFESAKTHWAHSEAFRQKELPKGTKAVSPFLPVGKPLVGEDYAPKGLTDDDLWVLMRHWGYQTGDRSASSVGVRSFRVSRAGLDVHVIVSARRSFSLLANEFSLSYSFGDESLGDAWARTPPKLDWAEVLATPGSTPLINKEVLVGKALTLRQIRQEVETFFERLSEFISTTPAKRPPWQASGEAKGRSRVPFPAG